MITLFRKVIRNHRCSGSSFIDDSTACLLSFSWILVYDSLVWFVVIVSFVCRLISLKLLGTILLFLVQSTLQCLQWDAHRTLAISIV